MNALAYAGRTETAVLLEEPETLDAELLQEKEAEANAEAEKAWLGLTMFTEGPRLGDGAAGYAVVWKNGQSWVGIKTHMGFNQDSASQKYVLHARKHIAVLQKARPGMVIEIRWCPAQKEFSGNEKADERAKLATEPDARAVEWLNYSDRLGARAVPLPRPLAPLRREIS